MNPKESIDQSNLSVADLLQDDSFIRWVRGEDPGAELVWTARRVSSPEMEEKIDKARSLVLSLQFHEERLSDQEIDMEWRKANALASQESSPKLRRLNWFKNSGYLGMAAAAMILVLILPVVYFLNSGEGSKSKTPENQIVSSKASPGQKLSIALSDGTKIILNSGSELRYPNHFSGDSREVTLEGEAYFEVASNKDMPFEVTAHDVTVIVLGTSFNVSAYPESPDIKVALVEGKVRVNIPGPDRGTDVFLSPSEMIEVDKSSNSFEVQPFDPLEMTMWKDGYLYLGKTDFDETILKLERWFGVDFEMDPSFKRNHNWRFIGKFHNKSLSYILETLSYPDLFEYRIESKKVFIK